MKYSLFEKHASEKIEVRRQVFRRYLTELGLRPGTAKWSLVFDECLIWSDGAHISNWWRIAIDWTENVSEFEKNSE
jgi:hypothetical protein